MGSFLLYFTHATSRRGYLAYGTDEHGYSRWANRLTGKVTIPPEGFDIHAWYEDNEWELAPSAIARAHDEAIAGSKNIFLAGVAAGIDEAWETFDKVFVLSVGTDTLRNRIAYRKDNNFGKAPKELKIILEWQGQHISAYAQRGALIVDATPPVTAIVDDILSKTSS